MKKLISIVLCVVVLVSSFSCTMANAAVTDNYAALIEIAKAYDRQGGQILYDQYYARRNIYSSPEDATSQRTVYMDCSSFVNSCYREAFGVNIMPCEIGESGTSPTTENMNAYAAKNPDAVDVAGYWEPADFTDEQKEDTKAFLYKNVRIGDILVYRHGKEKATKGHVYMYIGDSTYMHCAGSGSYYINSKNIALSHDDSEVEEDWGGTIQTIDMDLIFDKSSSRYIFKKTASDTVRSFALLRPLARGLTLTDETVNRMKISGLSMEKICSVSENTAVDKGDEITYTVIVDNTNAHSVNGVNITDDIPAGTGYVSADRGVTCKKGKISWNGNIPANTTVRVSYTVRVTEDTPGYLIKSRSTSVSGVKLGSITHSVAGINQNQRALIGEALIECADLSKSFENGFELVKTVYRNTLGIDMNEFTDAAGILDSVIDKEGRTLRTDTALSEMVAPNLYGGQDIKYGWLYLPTEEDKTRRPKAEHLSTGDIIIADWAEGSLMYVYAGNDTLVTVDNGVCKKRTIDPDIYSPERNFLITLLAYSRYAVLRPSMVYQSGIDISKIDITSPPKKTAYRNYEFFEPDGMKLTVTLNDGTAREVKSYVYDSSHLKYGDNSIAISFGDLTANVKISVSETNSTPVSVSEASLFDDSQKIFVEGIVLGVSRDGRRGKNELYIKDVSNDAVLAVRLIPYGHYPDYGYKSGDRIAFLAAVKHATPVNMTYKEKTYLEFSPENGDIETTIISRGNQLPLPKTETIELNTWEDMQNYFKVGETPLYTYVRIPAGTYFMTSPQEEGEQINITYVIHKNPQAKTSADMYAGSKAHIGVRQEAMERNLGADWKKLLFEDESALSPGTFVSRDIVALYVGGEKNIYQLIIPDKSWITPKTTFDVEVAQPGRYKVIFVDYKGNLPQKAEAYTVDIQGGRVSLKIPEAINLSIGDRVILWNMDNGTAATTNVFGAGF